MPYEYSKMEKNIITSEHLLFFKVLSERNWYYENNYIIDEPVKFYWGGELNIFIMSKNKKINKNTYSPMIKTLKNNSIDESDELKSIMNKEYARYIVVDNMSNIKTGYDWLNILERFLNSMANIKNKKEKKEETKEDEVLVNIPLTHSIYKKLISEMNEKKISNPEQVATNISNIIKKYINIETYSNISNYGQQTDYYYCELFYKKIDKIRELSLIKRLGLSNNSKYYVQLMINVMLRYECILAGNQNWNWPYLWYNYIYEKYNVILEGFSSPLNSQLLLLGDNTHFGSLFYDTDKLFGSVGNIFDLDIKSYYEKYNTDNKLSVAFNPPYIESIIDNMIDLIDKWFRIVPHLRIFTGVPYWSDTTFVRRLENHRYLKYKKILGKNEYYYENSLQEDIPKITHTSKLEIFVLANFEKDINEPEYNTTLKLFKHPYNI